MDVQGTEIILGCIVLVICMSVYLLKSMDYVLKGNFKNFWIFVENDEFVFVFWKSELMVGCRVKVVRNLFILWFFLLIKFF